ncbi:helix-turn-helix domain-containing protein [Halovivax gelatinilyticus]|uniref:helix-turn-helix domain-containing protein n=1 Tax=Halovivax gelatinilyticus TaxID=2961597 RepID=UPI0020CA6E84|nr:helix-turn-helix domain-containing protein [Halovivax gelatinilyticus]
MTGYQATIVVDDPGGCPVALAADRAGTTVDSVSRSSRRDSSTVVEEFTIEDPEGDLVGPIEDSTTDREPTEDSTTECAPIEPAVNGSSTAPIESNGVGTAAGSVSANAGDVEANGPVLSSASVDDTDSEPISLTPVAGAGSDRTYRFTRDWTNDCVCEVVEGEGNPVSSLRAVEGALHVRVTGPDLETLSATVTALKSSFEGVKLNELTQSTASEDSDLVLIDRARLTDRQREVLETAHDLGYFEYPKGANAGEVADELDISGSTFAEHLGAAQSKLLDAILEE